jgi:hypothetical protein
MLPIWAKKDAEYFHIIPLSNYEFHENQCTESNLRRGLKTGPYVLHVLSDFNKITHRKYPKNLTMCVVKIKVG